jgi:putative aldouronate transport system permease protein
MVLPGLIFLIAFSYMPMPAIVLAFKNYKMAMPPEDAWIRNPFIYSLIYNSPWVGFNNFKFIIGSPELAIFLRNTLGYNLTFMFVGLCFAVGIAVGINELRQRFMAKLYHTILFLPYFLSWVIVTYVLYAFISSNGVINHILESFGREKVQIYSKISAWPFIFVLANVWRYAGNSSIIYLATITGFDQQLYEAAAMDGAGKWKQFRFITFPLLVPTIILLQILAVGRILNGDFDMFYSLPNGSGMIKDASLTIDIYVFEALRSGQPIGLPAAAALFQSGIGFLLVLTTNAIVRRIDGDMAMF